jgi:hypothetical protein
MKTLVDTEIKPFCNLHLWSDIEPYEVVEVINPKKVLIRKMDAVLKVAPKTYHVGGFAAHCEDNMSQRWKCTSNPEYPLEGITLTKNGWGKTGSHGLYRMSETPQKFYDYNF